MTRRRFILQTVGMIGGTMVTGNLFPLLAEAAKRKQILRVAIERDIETLRPELSSGDTVNLLRRLIYITPILWGTRQRPDGSLIYDADSIETALATAYKVSPDRQLIEFTLRDNAKFANGDPINAQAFKESYAWLLGARSSGQLRVNGVPSADHIEVVDEVMVRLHLDRPVAWGLTGNALLSTRTAYPAGGARCVHPAHCPGTWGRRFCRANRHQGYSRPALGLWRQSRIIPQRPWVVVGHDLEQGAIQQYPFPSRHGVGHATGNAAPGRHTRAGRTFTELCAQ
jgi:hypothetical protein